MDQLLDWHNISETRQLKPFKYLPNTLGRYLADIS